MVDHAIEWAHLFSFLFLLNIVTFYVSANYAQSSAQLHRIQVVEGTTHWYISFQLSSDTYNWLKIAKLNAFEWPVDLKLLRYLKLIQKNLKSTMSLLSQSYVSVLQHSLRPYLLLTKRQNCHQWLSVFITCVCILLSLLFHVLPTYTSCTYCPKSCCEGQIKRLLLYEYVYTYQDAVYISC